VDPASAGALAGLLVSVPAPAGAAEAATHYTHSTTLKQDCAIHTNWSER
jgi:hypothetical protein